MMQEQEKEALLNLLKNDNPYLYLGAGFSYGAKHKNDETKIIPDGQKLKNIVLSKIEETNKDIFEEEKNNDLASVCQALKDLDEDLYLTTILGALRDFLPLPYHFYIADYKWHSIFTVNIDTIVEQVFHNIGNDNLQVFINKGNKENVIEKKQKLFKLHGCVNHPEEGIVFSRNEYIEAMTRNTDYKLLNLKIALSSNGFVVVGTEMKEAELNYFKTIYEKSGDELTGHKIIFINPFPKTSFLNYIKKHDNFMLIQCTTEEFCNFLHNNKQNLTKEFFTFRSVQKRYMLYNLPLLMENYKSAEEKKYKTKLYYGDAPTWQDLLHGFIIPYSQIEETQKKIRESGDKRVFIITGALYSGKTSFLMQLFLELSAIPSYLCLYNTSDEFDIGNIRSLLKNNSIEKSYQKIILFSDNCGEEYGDFQNILDLDSRLSIITTSYEIIYRRKRYALPVELSERISLSNHLKEQDVHAIKEKLDEKGLSGKLIGKDVDEWKKVINVHENIVSALYNLTQGLHFQEHFAQIVETDGKLQLEEHHALIAIAAMCYKLGIPYVRPEMLSEENILVTKQLLDDCCDYLVVSDTGAIKIKSLFIANCVLSRNDVKSELRRYIINICKSIAPSIRERGMNYHKKVYEYVTKYKYLKSLGLTEEDINFVYAEIHPFYSDKSYYWLQAGLAEQAVNEFEYALTHFESARSINPSSYAIIHATARNYCKQAQSLDSRVQALAYFSQGERLFMELIENKQYVSSKSYAIHSLICETIHFYRLCNMPFSEEKMLNYKELLFEAMQKDGQDEIMVSLNEKFSKFIKLSVRDEKEMYGDYENNLDY